MNYSLKLLISGLLLLMLIACTLTACIPETEQTTYQEGVEFKMITGEILSKAQAGIDGDVWIVESEDGTRYEVLLSIPNLGEIYSRDINQVEIGVTITVSGSTFFLNEFERVIAKTLEVL